MFVKIKNDDDARFSPSDWSASNIDHYNSADSSRNQSERIRNEAVRLIREREDKTTLTQRDSDRRIGERLHDEVMAFVRNENVSATRFYADVLEIRAPV